MRADLAALRQDGGWIPGMALPAIQGGKHAAANVRLRAAGRPTRPFRYRHLGSLATIGRSAAVADVLGFRFAGRWAWILWLWVHIVWLIRFRNRFVVLFDWVWAYLTYQPSARVIMESAGPWAAPPAAPEPGVREARAAR